MSSQRGSARAREEDVSALVGAVRSGEPSAIDAWFRGEHPVVYRLCYGLLANAAEAEDAAQDALVHVLERLERWDARRSYGAWRSAVVVNLCRDRLRRRAARVQAERAGALVELADAAGPPQRAEEAELAELLRAALEALTPREREVFVLRDLEGVASAEVAQVLEVTESTVRSLLTLARRRLRALLGPRLFAGSADQGGERV
jgi:RNA polymerase sigma-70 factor (ECF subfamily)